MSHPPKLAQALLSLSIPVSNREPILGDFAEEYLRRSQQSNGSAQLWYWKQALLSLPYLIYGRIKSNPILMQVLLISIAYLVFLAWMAIAFYLFRLAYTTNIFQGNKLLALTVRLLIESTGFMVAGGMVRYGQIKLLPANLKKSLLPLMLMLILLVVPTLIAYAGAEHVILKRYLLTKAVVIFPSFLLGVYLMSYISRRARK